MKVGDRVLVITDPEPYRRDGFIRKMDKYCGKAVTIKWLCDEYSSAGIIEDESRYIWAQKWLRPMKQRTE